MKFLQLQQSESMPMEFQGLSVEDAVQRARLVLGNDAPVRCWKTRRGGVFGFFSKEIFVAGINEPAGALKGPRADRAVKSETRDLRANDPWSALQEPTDFHQRPSLADLVESTRDELTVEGVLMSEAAFIDVLAQAEAALVDLDVIPVEARSVIPPSVPGAESVAHMPIESLRSELLRSVLVELGVPIEYQPDTTTPTLDDVASSLDRLPVSAPIPVDEGSLIVVVGARGDARQAAQRLVEKLQLTNADLVTYEDTPTCRQRVSRRRSSKKVTVLAFEASPRLRELGDVAAQLGKLRPDYVLGALPATLKRADVEQWRTGLGRVDALALSRWAQTASPAELMGTLPITFVDGRCVSTLRWMLLILEKMEGHAP